MSFLLKVGRITYTFSQWAALCHGKQIIQEDKIRKGKAVKGKMQRAIALGRQGRSSSQGTGGSKISKEGPGALNVRD